MPRFSARIVVAPALVVAAAGSAAACNALLDNEPATLAAPDDAASAPWQDDPTGERSRAGDATDDPSGDASAAEPSCAPPHQKPCGTSCVPVDDPAYGCGRPSCEPCAPANATATCAGGACAIGACEDGFADCNGDPSDGCEADLGSVATCGACGVACPLDPNTEPTCVAGACVVRCVAGFADCNRKRADGCEVDLEDDDDNCGACRRRCRFGHCVSGTCKIVL